MATYTLLGVFGSLVCIFLGDMLGRRKTIFIASVVQAIGAILQASTFDFAQLVVGRVVLGLGTGGLIATISVWQSEASKAESRGEHVSAFGVFAGLGLSLALWIPFGMSFTEPSSAAWRFPLAFTVFLSILVCLSIFALPESPRWLCKKNRWEEARATIGVILDDDAHGDAANQAIRDIQASFESSGDAKLRDMFKMGRERTFHRVMIAATAQMLLQMTGINSIAYYAPTIYHNQLHYSRTISGILSAASQLVMAVGSLCCAWTVDRFGRRKLMMFSAAMQSTCFACIAAVTAHPENKEALKAGVFLLYFYFFVAVLGFLGIPFLYASEIAPTRLRAPICGLSTATSWLFNFLVAEVTPVAFNTIGFKYFIVYCCLNAAWVPLVYYFFPETARFSLEEIDNIFMSSENIFDPVRVARRNQKARKEATDLEVTDYAQHAHKKCD